MSARARHCYVKVRECGKLPYIEIPHNAENSCLQEVCKAINFTKKSSMVAEKSELKVKGRKRGQRGHGRSKLMKKV